MPRSRPSRTATPSSARRSPRSSSTTRGATRDPAGANRSRETLTNREREILQLVAEGRSSPEIARQLSLSVKTVEGHRGRIMAKLDVHHVAGLVRHAIRIGLVSPDA
ncbi:response regulator transcription factor [Nannocystis pusilla]|uniref:response regulator transcription factor n=1 Tax=Nannocystis pusilla TaxID=889268 RepID=UPI003B7B24A6